MAAFKTADQNLYSGTGDTHSTHLCSFCFIFLVYCSLRQHCTLWGIWFHWILFAYFIFCLVLLMKVLSHPGHGKGCIVGNRTCLIFLEIFHLLQLPTKKLRQVQLPTIQRLESFLYCVLLCSVKHLLSLVLVLFTRLNRASSGVTKRLYTTFISCKQCLNWWSYPLISTPLNQGKKRHFNLGYLKKKC